jgi:glycosyltransferase involved in cell wall biosynthesis
MVPAEFKPTARRAGVTALVEPYCKLHDQYQSYYRNSIAAYCSRDGIPFRETGGRFPGTLRFLSRVRHSRRFETQWRRGPEIVDNIAARLGAVQSAPEHAVGQYVFREKGATLNICIDAHDSRLVMKPDFLEWSDIYYKTNFWPTEVYPAKVTPIANLNPSVLNHQTLLRHYRDQKKELDLYACIRVWGGTDELEGVEHNLRLLEVLARVKCRKKLLAYLVAGNKEAAIKRLEKAGIPWTTEWTPQAELWSDAANSRLNIVRHGMHQCIPWRMTDIMAMGGCPVLDYAATTRWHVPLVENRHYLNLGIPYRPNEAAAFDADEVVEHVERWVSDEELTRSIGEEAARYFDEYLTPEALGSYILRRGIQPDAP